MVIDVYIWLSQAIHYIPMSRFNRFKNVRMRYIGWKDVGIKKRQHKLKMSLNLKIHKGRKINFKRRTFKCYTNFKGILSKYI